MAMNVPPEDMSNAQQQPVVDEASMTDTVVTPSGEASMTEEVVDTGDVSAQEVQDQQVIDQVAQTMMDEEITGEDILIALLVDQFGISPTAASSLLSVLLTEDEGPDTAEVVDETMIQGE